ncbi:MAG: hypothetical protein H2174_00815 [Vampirovibrio sp.]|nr:hypothetical protein [Vampirovibrio sp.]
MMMMMSSTNPFQNSVSNTLHSLGNWTYDLNERGKRRAVQLRAEAEAAPSFLKPVAKAAASPLATLLTNGTKTNFDHFSFTPELGGFTIPHLPLMATLIMFYGFMMPARVDSELKRADNLTPQEQANEGFLNKGVRQIIKLFYREGTIKTDSKTNPDNNVNTVDVRPVRDVIIRDMLSISLFLFALEPAQQLLRVKKQNDGGLFSFGKNNTQPVLAIMDRPWSPNGEMEAWSYEKTNRLYQLNNLKATENFANLFGGNTYNRHSAEIFRRAVTPINLYTEDATFKTATDGTIGQLHQIGTRQNALTNAFKKYYQDHELTHKKQLGIDENLALSLLFEKLPTLKNHENVETFAQVALIAEVVKAKEIIQQKIKDSLTVAGFDLGALESLKAGESGKGVHHTHKPFAESFLKAYHEGDREAYHKMMLLASNVGGFVDSVVEKQGKSGSESRFDRYGKAWGSLQGLQDLLPQYHLLRHTETMLKEESPTTRASETGFLAGVKGLFSHSKQALAGIEQLDLITKKARSSGKAVGVKNLFGKVTDTFNPTEVFKDFARSMKAPVDWMTFVLVAGVIGFVPVWINQVYTDLEFKLKHAKDKTPPAGPEPLEEDLEAFDYLPIVPKSGPKPVPTAITMHRFQDLANNQS